MEALWDSRKTGSYDSHFQTTDHEKREKNEYMEGSVHHRIFWISQQKSLPQKRSFAAINFSLLPAKEPHLKHQSEFNWSRKDS